MKNGQETRKQRKEARNLRKVNWERSKETGFGARKQEHEARTGTGGKETGNECRQTGRGGGKK